MMSHEICSNFFDRYINNARAQKKEPYATNWLHKSLMFFFLSTIKISTIFRLTFQKLISHTNVQLYFYFWLKLR